MSNYYNFIGLSIDFHISQHDSENPFTYLPHIEPEIYCPYCFPPNNYPDRRFINFWSWIQTYHAVSYNRTSENIFHSFISQDLTLDNPRRIVIRLLNTIVFTIRLTVKEQTFLVNSVISTAEESNTFETPSTGNTTDNESDTYSETLEDLTVTLDQLVIQSPDPQPAPEETITETTTVTTITMTDMDALVKVLGELTKSMKIQRMEKIIIPIRKFRGNDQDPVEWLNDFEIATKANGITNERKLEIIRGYLEGPAAAWFDQRNTLTGKELNEWENTTHDEHDFSHQFIEKFRSPRKVQQWQDELETMKQTGTVEEYTNKFVELMMKIDPKKEYPDEYRIRIYKKGVKPEIRKWVNLNAEQNDLDDIFETAKSVEEADYDPIEQTYHQTQAQLTAE